MPDRQPDKQIWTLHSTTDKDRNCCNRLTSRGEEGLGARQGLLKDCKEEGEKFVYLGVFEKTHHVLDNPSLGR